MRRRAAVVADDGRIPARLLDFAIGDWMAEDEAPELDWLARKVRAYKRWLAARREFAERNGLDYADTFRPEWRQRRTP